MQFAVNKIDRLVQWRSQWVEQPVRECQKDLFSTSRTGERQVVRNSMKKLRRVLSLFSAHRGTDTDGRVKCTQCRNRVLKTIAASNDGLCGVCFRRIKRDREAKAQKAALDADIRTLRYQEEFDRVRRMCVNATRRAFARLERECQGDSIYAVAIYAHGRCGPPIFCGSTLKWLAEQTTTDRFAAADDTHQDQGGTTTEEDMLYSKWSPYEWEYEAYCFDEFSGIVSHVNDLEPKLDSETTTELHSMLLAAYVGCLRDLDNEGIFDTQRNQAFLALFCSVCDSKDAEWYEHASAKFLNSPAIFEVFFNESVAYNLDEENRLKNLLGDETQRRFAQYLDLI